MAATSILPPLSNVQAELLKLFSAEIPENDLLELRKVIAKFLLEKAKDKADLIRDRKGYTDERLLEILGKSNDLLKNETVIIYFHINLSV